MEADQSNPLLPDAHKILGYFLRDACSPLPPPPRNWVALFIIMIILLDEEGVPFQYPAPRATNRVDGLCRSRPPG